MIDCMIIGHNEMEFKDYWNEVQKMGQYSGAMRDLELNYFHYDGQALTMSDIIDAVNINSNGTTPIVTMNDVLSAAISYLVSYLNSRGISTQFVNNFKSEKKRLVEILTTEELNTIAITTTYYVSAFPIIEIISFIRKFNSSAKIIIGGPFVSNQIKNFDQYTLKVLFESSLKADYYINSSQGEQTLYDLIVCMKEGKSIDKINNLLYIKDGKLIQNKICIENNILEENLVNWQLFYDKLSSHVNVRTAISCPFSCSFCGFPEHAGKYQTISVKCVQKELILLKKSGKVKYINFIDDTFNFPLNRFKEILRMMIEHNFDFKWSSYIRCQFIDEETVKLMHNSGCQGVFLGLESGSDKILKNMNKKVSVFQYRDAVNYLKKYNIKTFGSFIIGFPGETDETFNDTYNFIETSGIDFYRAQLWYCDPITPIWKEKDKYKIEGSNFEWSHSSMNSSYAQDLVDKLFMEIDNPIWIPQYNFDIIGYYHLINSGFSHIEATNILELFRDGIRLKLNGEYDSSNQFISILKILNRINRKEEILHLSKEDDFDTSFDF